MITNCSCEKDPRHGLMIRQQAQMHHVRVGDQNIRGIESRFFAYFRRRITIIDSRSGGGGGQGGQ